MKYKLYATSVKAWDAMLKAIDSAKKSIYMEMYIFLDDTSESHDFIGKLKEKAKEGIRVALIVDGFGSRDLKKESVEAMRRSGIELIFFSGWLRRIHRKVLIIDEKIAFLGGVNIGKSFQYWKDLQIRIKGKIVKKVLQSLAYTYKMAGGKNRIGDGRLAQSSSQKFRFWMFKYGPIYDLFTFRSHYIKKISEAQKTILIMTPYFAPSRWFIALLDSAVKRGVKVEIIVPKKTDYKFVDRINHRYMYNLSSLGIKFYLSNEMNHSKILLIDNKEAMIGSQNIDVISLNVNMEAGVFFQQKDAVDELYEIANKWKSEAEVFITSKYKMKFIDYIILFLTKLFKSVL